MKTTTKNILLTLLFTLPFFEGCKQEVKYNGQTKKTTTIQEPEYFDYRNTIVNHEFSDTIFMCFSDDSVADCFTFYMPTGNINKTQCVLRITSNTGELIYENIFTTSDIVNGYSTHGIKNDEEMEKYVLEEAKSVLNKESFCYLDNPEEDSIIKQTPKEEIKDYETFIECKNDNRPLFCLRLHEEDITFMGFSKKKGKVVDLIYCC